MKKQIAATLVFASLANPVFGQTRALYMSDVDRCIQAEVNLMATKEEKPDLNGWMIIGKGYRDIRDGCSAKFPGQHPLAFKGGVAVVPVFENGREKYVAQPIDFGMK